MMTTPNLRRKFTLVVSAALLALLLFAPAALAASPTGGDGDHRIAMAETPRDRLGLLLLGALVVGSGAALVNARRQLKGERGQATGEFRWR
ncbi:MAG: hypothetical protein WD576_05225 [Nitriliruptoraceae bacterium]